MNEPTSSRLVIIDYTDLTSSQDISTQLQRAFGSSSTTDSPLGIIAIRNIPNFLEAKRAFLPQAHKLAHLDASYLDEELTDEASLYNAGWSRGKEKLGDVPDFAKASYYFNPLTDQPGTPEERKEYPASYPCNKWPNEEEVRDLEGFRSNAQRLGRIMHETVVLLAKHIDNLANREVDGYSEDLLYNAMKETEKAKGRLLYYYPLEEIDCNSFDNWIGWHNDSGFLTSLAGDLYIDDRTGKPLDTCQIDPEAGLYVTDRSGKSIHVTIPEDCMAVQIGECVQILTGGVVCATPHCVKGTRSDYNGAAGIKVARISCPCFIDSKPTFRLTAPRGSAREEIVGAGIGRDKVPALEERWLDDGMTFGEFLQKTFEKYYDWKG
jgi:isopenicillin N synthase-like dioxygenase